MRVRTGLLAALAMMLVGVTGAIELAQAQPTNTPKAPTPTSPTAGMQQQVNVPPETMARTADEILAHIFALGKTVRKLHQDARDNKDVVKALCLDNKLTELDVAYRTASDRRTELASAISRNDTELANHLFTVVSLFREKSEKLMSEANQCIGTDVQYSATSSVTPNVEQGIPDTTDVRPSDNSSVGFIAPPSCVSCFL